MATMLKCAADNLRCRLISSRGLSHHAAISAPLGRMMDCTTGLQFVLPESNNESQEDPKIELPNPYFSGSMELMAVPKRKVGFLYRLLVSLSIWVFQILIIDFWVVL